MQYTAHCENRKNTSPQNILFVHGNLASKYWWYPTIDILEKRFQSSSAALSGSMSMVELRGCGRSSLPADSVIRINDIVNDFILYTEKNNLKNVCVVGHSAGGLIAALLLARRPDLFVGGLLVDPVGPKGLVNIPADIGDRYRLMTEDSNLATQVISATVFQNNPETEFFKTHIMPDVMLSLKTSGTQLIEALTGIDCTNEVAQIRQPIKVFYGAHDWVLEASNALAYKELVINSVYELLPDNGHCLNYENPERMAEEIVHFLKDSLK